MSYTIVIDERQRRLDAENVANRLKRHCRIGRIAPKPSKLGLPQNWKWPGYGLPLKNGEKWWRAQSPHLPTFSTPIT